MNQRDLARCAQDPVYYRTRLIIDADGQPKPFKPDQWQDADFKAMDRGCMRAAGRGTGEAKMRAWLERPRGHDKSSGLALMAVWILLMAARPVKGIAAAGDLDQAGLLRAAIETLCRLNPWIGSVLKVDRWKVTNTKTGAELEIISSDAATSYGALPDFIVCDELSHWAEGKGEALWVSLLSAAAKRRDCMFVVITNAGFTESWQWKVREKIRTDPSWYFSRLEGPVASWITPDRLEEQRRLLPDIAYRRLWENQWTSGAGDALTEADIDAAVVLEGPAAGPRRDWYYFAGGDLGLRRDRASVAITGVDPQGGAHLVYLKAWAPGFLAGIVGRKEIDLNAVEAEIRRLFPLWNLLSIHIDEWQAAQLLQSCQRDGLRAEGITYTASVLAEVATICIERFRDRSIFLWRDEQLLKDLRRLRIEERPGGFKLVSPRGADGHGDRVSAWLLSLLGIRRFFGDGQKRPPASWDGSFGLPQTVAEGRLAITEAPDGVFGTDSVLPGPPGSVYDAKRGGFVWRDETPPDPTRPLW